ncbi:hypothetical protein TTHERM_000790748 (macronuclear) [Tetrahymena thermophila SB210]|uniref:Uncharacterized protein n=1 Tax=Tetrahymena thermophila (strain SB210) TaxID=312017 RepID=W7X1D0_TETTS|nr:hypothetical protein TTHERM_000790748 [Tetrahymena thermophila SB210]EWS71397.1 hypothetical protein TTHERM_000790748 [Tetrahymena thermophila SB210]|eukprot:XP_012656069.1 hypothetical protein TTHERM_000790748 [Tetrahymena thermophila SB210]
MRRIVDFFVRHQVSFSNLKLKQSLSYLIKIVQIIKQNIKINLIFWKQIIFQLKSLLINQIFKNSMSIQFKMKTIIQINPTHKLHKVRFNKIIQDKHNKQKYKKMHKMKVQSKTIYILENKAQITIQFYIIELFKKLKLKFHIIKQII